MSRCACHCPVVPLFSPVTFGHFRVGHSMRNTITSFSIPPIIGLFILDHLPPPIVAPLKGVPGPRPMFLFRLLVPPIVRPLTFAAMWCPMFCLLLAGLAACCVSLPQMQYVNDKPFYLMQNMECRGAKLLDINRVQDIDECKAACVQRNCQAVNLFQLGEFQFKCEILAYVSAIFPAQGAACYRSYY